MSKSRNIALIGEQVNLILSHEASGTRQHTNGQYEILYRQHNRASQACRVCTMKYKNSNTLELL